MKTSSALAAAFIALALSGCRSEGPKDTPEGTSDTFMRCLYEGSRECVLSVLHFEATAKNHPEKAEEAADALIQAARSDAQSNGGVASVSSGAPSYDPDRIRASVPVEILYSGSAKTRSTTLYLVKGQGDDVNWYVDFR